MKAFVWSMLTGAFVLVLRLAAKIRPFKVGYVVESRIGHLVSELDVMLRSRALRGATDEPPVLVITGKACNRWILPLFRHQVKIIESQFLRNLIVRGARERLQKTGLWVSLRTETNEFREFAETRGQAIIPDHMEQKARALLARMNIGENDWWVCFHARDSLAVPADIYPYDHSYHDYRNVSIHSMVKAMEYVTEQGGYAIRMGAAADERLDVSGNPKIIDYTHAFRDELLDIYLLARCRFFVGCSSGLLHVPKCFDVPFLLTNLIGYLHLPMATTSLFMPKLIRRQGGDLLSFAECEDMGMFDLNRGNDFYYSETYEKRGLEVVDNDAEDILAATRDLMRLAQTGASGTPPTADQTAFKDRYYAFYEDRHLAGNIAPSFLARHKRILS